MGPVKIIVIEKFIVIQSIVKSGGILQYVNDSNAGTMIF